jgi:hypothetical protein
MSEIAVRVCCGRVNSLAPWRTIKSVAMRKQAIAPSANAHNILRIPADITAD